MCGYVSMRALSVNDTECVLACCTVCMYVYIYIRIFGRIYPKAEAICLSSQGLSDIVGLPLSFQLTFW